MRRPADLPLLAGATLLSAAGDLVLVVVLALHVQAQTGSGFAVAALFAALMGPVALLAGPAGRLVDGMETRRVLLLVSAAQAVVGLGLVLVDGLAATLALTALLGAGAAVAGPAEAALVPAVSGRGASLARANAWMETARYTGYTLGPVLAAGLVAFGGTRVALAVDAASFVVVAIAAALLRVRRPPVPAAGAAPAPRTARAWRPRRAFAGANLLLDDPQLRTAVVAAVAGLLFISASITVEVFYVRETVGAGPAGYALVMASWMAGMVVGAVGVAPRLAAGPLALLATAALALQGAGMVGAALVPILVWVCAGFVVGGIGHGVKNVLMRTLIAERVAADRHGRAFAAYGAARNTAELGALGLGGVLVAVVGPQVALALAGAGPVVAGLLAVRVLTRTTTAPTPEPAISG